MTYLARSAPWICFAALSLALACSSSDDDDATPGQAGTAGASAGSVGSGGSQSQGGLGGASGNAGASAIAGSGGTNSAGSAGADTAGSAGQSGNAGAAGQAGTPDAVTLIDEFSKGALGWEAGFSDYSTLNMELELDSKITPQPAELGSMDTAFMLQGHNRSDDLFMFLKKRVSAADGIAPNQKYSVFFHIVFASNARSGCVGIGGAPGENVHLKAGASAIEPLSVLDEGQYSMNVDKGNQATGGPAGSVVGNIANGVNCDDEAPVEYVSRFYSRLHDATVTASDTGDIWLLVGTDSGFEGLTRIYYQRIEATLTKVE